MDIDDKNKTAIMDTVWPWKQTRNAAGKKQNNLQKGGWIQFAAMFFAASVFLFLFHHIFISIIIYFLSIVTLAGIFAFPVILRFFNAFGKITAELVGRLLTYLLLIPFYFLCFFPGRILLFVLGKDPMKRKFDRNSTSYWLDKKQTDEIDHYKVQYK